MISALLTIPLEETANFAEKASLISDGIRLMQFLDVLREFYVFKLSVKFLQNMTDLSFVEHPEIRNGVYIFSALAVSITTIVALYKYIALQADEPNERDIKEIFKSTIITTMMIILFVPLFGIVNELNTKFVTTSANISVDSSPNNENLGIIQYALQADIFSEPLFIDRDKEKEGATTVFDINEKCTKNTDKGCKEVDKGISIPFVKDFKTEYYRYSFNFNALRALIWFFTFCNYIISFQLITRIFKVTILYIFKPLTIALRNVDGLSSISSNMSKELYSSVLSIGFQILAMRIVALLFTKVLPEIQGGFGMSVVNYIVGFIFIISVPTFIKKLVGDTSNINMNLKKYIRF